ncbi:MAG: hypothetical protein V4751_01235 [Pseudomonadota bacterium]
MVVLLALCSSAVLILTIYLLHKHREKESMASVDRTTPLPPLEHGLETSFLVEAAEDILGLASRGVLRAVDPSTTEEVTTMSHKTSPATSWQDFVRELRIRGDYERALEVCIEAYPLRGAFRQSCPLIRAIIKQRKDSSLSIDDELHLLYRTSALAAFFHAKGDTRQLSSRKLRFVNCQIWKTIQFPYAEIGYEYLDLVTDADIKMFIEAWGLPETHVQVRTLYEKDWALLSESLLHQPSTATLD